MSKFINIFNKEPKNINKGDNKTFGNISQTSTNDNNIVSGGNININGKSYIGRSIRIANGTIHVDGDSIGINDKVIKIEVKGNINNIHADSCDLINVAGGCSSISTLSGDVRCGDVSGNVKTMSGDVTCGKVLGSVDTMSGDINRR